MYIHALIINTSVNNTCLPAYLVQLNILYMIIPVIIGTIQIVKLNYDMGFSCFERTMFLNGKGLALFFSASGVGSGPLVVGLLEKNFGQSPFLFV